MACQLAKERLPVRPAMSKKPKRRAAPLTLPIPTVDQAAPACRAVGPGDRRQHVERDGQHLPGEQERESIRRAEDHRDRRQQEDIARSRPSPMISIGRPGPRHEARRDATPIRTAT